MASVIGLASATPLDLLAAGVALLLALGVGTTAHELSHAIVLRALDVPCEIAWLPDRDGTDSVTAGFFGRWATVTPRRLPRELSPWGLRIAAIAPLALATPMALIFAGALPDPILTGSLPLVAAAMGWFGCAIPSPQDFSLFWYAERAIADHADMGFAGKPRDG